MDVQSRTVQTMFISVSAIYFGLLFGTATSYNVEVGKVGIARGKEGWQFGYTVAIVRAPGWIQNTTGFLAKELLVGAPNFEYNKIKGHGQISGCSDITAQNISCNWLNITDVSKMCDRLSKKTDTDCAMESRLGATMEVNRKYADVRDDVDLSMVTVCAPGWKNVIAESRKSEYQNYMLGMCLKMRDDLKPMTCTIETCFPFWPGKGTTHTKGRPMFSYAEAGLAAAYSLDGRREIVSAPGADDWRGAVRTVQKGWLVWSDYLGRNTTNYFGYAITTGKFGSESENMASGSPNGYSPSKYKHYGKVEVFYKNTKRDTIEYGIPKPCGDQHFDRGNFDDEQKGTKFGATLEAVDLNGDGFDELLIGAPLYTGRRADEGRVFVYTSSEGQTKICGPVGILSGGANDVSLKEKAAFARFGSTIASVGDLDLDGYQDVAIGAPYEDGGTGAVYIYNGFAQCGSKMEDIYSQRIAGKDIDAGLRSFGWSIYGNEDIDDNSFPDLAVGAYEANSVIVLRTRSVVNINVEISMSPNPIPLNGSLINCSINGELLCFEVTVLFNFSVFGTRTGNVRDIKLAWTFDSDTIHKNKEGWGRVAFRDNDGQGMLSENITISSKSNRKLKKSYTLDVKEYRGKPEPKDAWTKVRMEGSFELIPAGENDFKALDPIIHKDAKRKIIKHIEFDKKCDSGDMCTSDLKLAVEMFVIQDEFMSTKVEEDTVIYVDTANILEVTADIINRLNSSYRASLAGKVTALMKKDALPNNGLVGGSCNKESLHQTSTNISCTADSKLDRNENMKIKMYFDISRQRLVPNMNIGKMKEFVHISLKADQANKDVNIDNNMFEKKIGVQLKYDVRIEEDKDISDQIPYLADQTSKRKITMIHRYYIINDGPSFLPKTFVNITIPLSKNEILVAVIKNMSDNCRTQSNLPQVQSTTPVLTTHETTIPSYKPNTDVERKRREAGQETVMAKSLKANADQTQTGKNITCKEYVCATVECKVANLEKTTNEKQEYIEITIDIYEKELAKEKDVREVKYATMAIVTDPAVWYGGKVVPWERTVYVEKWTTFVVEPTSVVSEINIWIIIGSVLGGLVLLVAIVSTLWRCGFFNRKTHSQVQEWKKNKQVSTIASIRRSADDNQPDTAIEERKQN